MKANTQICMHCFKIWFRGGVDSILFYGFGLDRVLDLKEGTTTVGGLLDYSCLLDSWENGNGKIDDVTVTASFCANYTLLLLLPSPCFPVVTNIMWGKKWSNFLHKNSTKYFSISCFGCVFVINREKERERKKLSLWLTDSCIDAF